MYKACKKRLHNRSATQTAGAEEEEEAAFSRHLTCEDPRRHSAKATPFQPADSNDEEDTVVAGGGRIRIATPVREGGWFYCVDGLQRASTDAGCSIAYATASQAYFKAVDTAKESGSNLIVDLITSTQQDRFLGHVVGMMCVPAKRISVLS